MGQNFTIVIAFLCHAVGTVLTHTDTVPIAVCCKNNGLAFCAYREVGGGKFQCLSDFTACIGCVSDCECTDISTFCAGLDFDIGSSEVSGITVLIFAV